MIYDCRRKEVLKVERKGGDVELRIENIQGEVLFKSWFQLKKPYKKNFSKILLLFNNLKSLFERQEERD